MRCRCLCAHIFLNLCVLSPLLRPFITVSLKYPLQVQTNLAKSEEYQVEPETDSQASSCLCTDESKSYHWNVTAVKLGKRRKWQMGKESTETENSTLSSTVFALFSLSSSLYLPLFFSLLSLCYKKISEYSLVDDQNIIHTGLFWEWKREILIFTPGQEICY